MISRDDHGGVGPKTPAPEPASQRKPRQWAGLEPAEPQQQPSRSPEPSPSLEASEAIGEAPAQPEAWLPDPPKKRRGGRKPGQLNRKTRERLARIEQDVEKSKRGGKLAIDHMDEMIEFLRNLVGALLPWNTDGSMREGRSEASFFRAMESFQAFLNMRAPYQSPRLSAVAIMPAGHAQASRTTVNVTILNEKGEKVYSDEEAGEDAKLIEHEPSKSEEEAA